MRDIINERVARTRRARAAEAGIDSETLKGQLELVYRYVLKYPSRTSRELAAILKRETSQNDRYLFSKRCSDLRKLGLVANGIKRKCKVTKREVLTWFVPASGGQ